jgi:peptidoglycan/LPS O-acetylase OafA/YrhL
MSVLWVSGLILLDRTSLWAAVTYTMNYVLKPSWALGHLWSLSVEEQFYLLWPPVFVFLGCRKAPWAAVCVIGISPVARAVGWLAFRGTPAAEMAAFPMVADSLAAGCLLACARSWLERQRWYLELFRPVYSLSLVALIFMANRYMGYGLGYVFGTSVINISLVVLIHRSAYHPGDWAGKILNWKPVAGLGVLSYSLYLWQQPFLDRTSTALVKSFPINIVLAFAAALSSYLLLEKPLLRLRHRLHA